MKLNKNQCFVLCLTGIFLLTCCTSHYISISAGFCVMAGVAIGYIYAMVLSY